MADLARLRQAGFRLASELFLLPDGGRLAALAEAAGVVRASCEWACGFSFFPEMDRFLGSLEDSGPEDRKSLEDLHTAVFGTSSMRKPAPLHEAGFLQQSQEAAGLMLASIEQHYASAGVSVSRFGAGMPDHISTELEFLALLCGREADAWEEGDLKAARRVQDRQRRFMEKHPANWLPALSAALAERQGGIFRQAVDAAHSLVAHDIDFLAALRARLREGVAG